MYNNKLAIAIKSGGRVLREFGDKVYVPFGTEYTILIKNLHTTKALVNITVDSSNATDSGLVIEAGKEIELERFLKKDLNKGNKFKFIERTSSIEKHRGIGLEDGLIVVNYQFEEPAYYPVRISPFVLYDYSPINPTWTICTNGNADLGGNSGGGSMGGTYTCNNVSLDASFEGNQRSATYSANLSATKSATNLNKETSVNGITVPGSLNEQKFVHAHVGRLEATKHSMVIKLLGETDDNKPVSRPVTVDIKPKCVTCGKNNKATSKFCNSCGTSLQILA